MPERLEVETPAKLLAFLKSGLDGWATRTLRMRLRLGCVLVNGERVTRNDHPLEVGDRVEVGDRRAVDVSTRISRDFTILYVDDEIIAIDKPAGLLSVSTDRQQQRTALALVRDSLSTPRKGAQLWPVHRLDRETSGVLLFARTRDARRALQTAWTEAQKIYLAIVEGQPKVADGVIEQPLWEDRRLNVNVGRRAESKEARTRYRTLERGRGRALLEVELDTGRRHQIRVHLAWLGHPVVGDSRYGSAGRRLGLHAHLLRVKNPRGGAPLTFEAPVPKDFSVLLNPSRR